jgi:hypothetical protein
VPNERHTDSGSDVTALPSLLYGAASLTAAGTAANAVARNDADAGFGGKITVTQVNTSSAETWLAWAAGWVSYASGDDATYTLIMALRAESGNAANDYVYSVGNTGSSTGYIGLSTQGSPTKYRNRRNDGDNADVTSDTNAIETPSAGVMVDRHEGTTHTMFVNAVKDATVDGAAQDQDALTLDHGAFGALARSTIGFWGTHTFALMGIFSGSLSDADCVKASQAAQRYFGLA